MKRSGEEVGGGGVGKGGGEGGGVRRWGEEVGLKAWKAVHDFFKYFF